MSSAKVDLEGGGAQVCGEGEGRGKSGNIRTCISRVPERQGRSVRRHERRQNCPDQHPKGRLRLAEEMRRVPEFMLDSHKREA